MTVADYRKAEERARALRARIEPGVEPGLDPDETLVSIAISLARIAYCLERLTLAELARRKPPQKVKERN